MTRVKSRSPSKVVLRSAWAAQSPSTGRPVSEPLAIEPQVELRFSRRSSGRSSTRRTRELGTIFCNLVPFHSGAQLAMDITLRSAVSSNAQPCRSGASTTGPALASARRDKRSQVRRVARGLSMSCGLWCSAEAGEFVDRLAAAKARDFLPVLRRSAHLPWRRHWIRMLSLSCGRAFAASLTAGPGDVWSRADGRVPEAEEMFTDFLGCR